MWATATVNNCELVCLLPSNWDSFYLSPRLLCNKYRQRQRWWWWWWRCWWRYWWWWWRWCLWWFSHKRSQNRLNWYFKKKNCNETVNEDPTGCQRWILRKKKTITKIKKEKFKDYCEADNNVHCFHFSEQLFGWPYQPLQICRCCCSGLHFPFHPLFDLSYCTPTIHNARIPCLSVNDATVQKRLSFFSRPGVFTTVQPR